LAEGWAEEKARRSVVERAEEMAEEMAEALGSSKDSQTASMLG
jgi:hypothetical protein